jgi:hypothetical protein
MKIFRYLWRNSLNLILIHGLFPQNIRKTGEIQKEQSEMILKIKILKFFKQC